MTGLAAAGAALGLLVGIAAATPASAGQNLSLGGTACSVGDISLPGGGQALDCVGFYHNNYNGGSSAQDAATAVALNALLGTSYTAATFPVKETMGSLSGNTINFAATLYGMTVVSFHLGGANGSPGGVGYNATAFYLFDAGTAGLDSFTFNRPGLSNARLYDTDGPPEPCVGNCGGVPGVPEPATWALMIIGFGGAGALIRRRRGQLA
jgi:hypothetical protein